MKDVNSFLDLLENKFVALQNETSVDVADKFKKLQTLIAEKDKNADKITDLIGCGESLFSDTATSGREIIRKELKDARERLVKLYFPFHYSYFDCKIFISYYQMGRIL